MITLNTKWGAFFKFLSALVIGFGMNQVKKDSIKKLSFVKKTMKIFVESNREIMVQY